MNHRFKHQIKATQLKSQIHTPYAYEQLLKNQRWAMANTAKLSLHTSGLITQSNHKKIVTDLHFWTCSCGHFQANGIPCGHGFTLIQTLQSDIPGHPKPRDYVPYYFTTIACLLTYLSNLRPISLDLVKSNSYRITDCNPVVVPQAEREAMGRPKVKRMIAGELRKNVFRAQAKLNGTEAPPSHGSGSQSCTLCGQSEHNRRKCMPSI